MLQSRSDRRRQANSNWAVNRGHTSLGIRTFLVSSLRSPNRQRDSHLGAFEMDLGSNPASFILLAGSRVQSLSGRKVTPSR